MLLLKSIVLFFMIYCNEITAEEYIGIRKFHKELMDPMILDLYNDTYNGHTRLSYVKSGKNDFVDSGKDEMFSVVIETYIDSITYRKSCWTNLTSAHKENVRLVALDNNRLVLLWTENTANLTQILNVYLINANVCELKNVSQNVVNLPSIRSFDRNVFVVPYGKVFDVMFSNFDKCKKRLCRVSYDSEGKLVGELTVLQDDTYDPSLTSPGAYQHFPHFAPVSQSFIKGYFMFVEEGDLLKIKTLDSHGEVSNSKIADIDPPTQNEERPFISSNSHETFGYCWIVILNRTVHCRQYDIGLNLKTNLTWTIGYYVTKASMYNLPNGGFLLLTEDSNYKSHYLTKVEADGRRSEPLELRGYCSPAILYEKTDGQFYCAYGLCWDRSSSNITVDVRCVPKRYFLIH